LVETKYYNDKIYLVFEYFDMDLKMYIQKLNLKSEQLPKQLIKSYLFQLLSGVEYLHSRKIIHRDLKPNNILINKTGRLKICDFGLSREFMMPITNMTPGVVTQYYRSPEIMLGSKIYTISIDIWAVGCIFAEMFLNKPLFDGESEIEQMMLMFSTLGTPTEEEWVGVSDLPYYSKFPNWKGNYLRKNIPEICNDGYDLLLKMLCYDPSKRITAKKALSHSYFDDLEIFK
jgi:serine/threonine protein kinase